MKLTRLEKILIVLIVGILASTFVITKVLAEQSTGTPNSEVNSVIKDVYENLVNLEYGSETGSNGPMWNRIISSSLWVPEGTITEADVVNGKTFFNSSRVEKTGTLDFPKYEDMSLQAKDYRDSNASTTWSSWTLTSGAATTGVYKDNRTGLYWSAMLGSANSFTNEFTIISCPFFTTVPRGDYNGGNVNCGDAINACATLSLDLNGDSTPETNWYLPTQAELMQAYLNGIYLSTNPTWVTANNFWSSTEIQDISTYAWYTHLNHGNTHYNLKTTSSSVRCVHRD